MSPTQAIAATAVKPAVRGCTFCGTYLANVDTEALRQGVALVLEVLGPRSEWSPEAATQTSVGISAPGVDGLCHIYLCSVPIASFSEEHIDEFLHDSRVLADTFEALFAAYQAGLKEAA